MHILKENMFKIDKLLFNVWVIYGEYRVSQSVVISHIKVRIINRLKMKSIVVDFGLVGLRSFLHS